MEISKYLIIFPHQFSWQKLTFGISWKCLLEGRTFCKILFLSVPSKILMLKGVCAMHRKKCWNNFKKVLQPSFAIIRTSRAYEVSKIQGDGTSFTLYSFERQLNLRIGDYWKNHFIILNFAAENFVAWTRQQNQNELILQLCCNNIVLFCKQHK